MAIKTIVTDLGRVVLLFDFNLLIKRLAQKSGLLESETLRRLNPQGEIFLDYIKGRTSPKDFHRHVCKVLETQISYEDFCDIWCNIWTPNDPVIQLWRKAKKNGHRIVLLSDLDELHHGWVTSHFQLEFLDASIYSFQVGCAKPSREIYRLTEPYCKCKIEEVVVVDDLIPNVLAPRSFGYNAVQYDGRIDVLCNELRKLGVRV